MAGLWWRDGTSEVLDALRHATLLLLQLGPIIAIALVLGGYVQALLPRDKVARWLGPASGARGYAVAMVAGAVTPAGPFAAFPIALALFRAGAGFNICVVYLTAWCVLGLQRVLIWEVPLLGLDFTALRLLVSLPLPILAGWLAGLTLVWWRR
ncbi:putative permease [Alkalispirillum mobile]|uniref:Putative permease n=1 Tax=Alkalispirillum mobile TaxID=85925 RepID=A0A498C3L7_9GAMM|nr:permease [Alkalispirillum mobile]RLK47061.1 putative permease [Alkalispirillum mobile]